MRGLRIPEVAIGASVVSVEGRAMISESLRVSEAIIAEDSIASPIMFHHLVVSCLIEGPAV